MFNVVLFSRLLKILRPYTYCRDELNLELELIIPISYILGMLVVLLNLPSSVTNFPFYLEHKIVSHAT